MIELLDKIEAAIDNHPRLTRKHFGMPFTAEAELAFSRDGWCARCEIRGTKAVGKGARHMMAVAGKGETPEAAADMLIEALTSWDVVLNGKA